MFFWKIKIGNRVILNFFNHMQASGASHCLYFVYCFTGYQGLFVPQTSPLVSCDRLPGFVHFVKGGGEEGVCS